MRNNHLKKLIYIGLILLSVCQIALAEEIPQPPFMNNKPADKTQFQSWLKNNGNEVKTAPINAPPKNIQKNRSAAVLQRKMTRAFANTDAVVLSAPMTMEESQKAMLNSIPPAPPPTPDSNAAFNSMMSKNMPLTPDQMVRLRQLIDLSQRAAAVPANVPPKPVSTTIMVNLAPGTTPPAIRLAQGYVSSLVFVDSTGAPWPIAGYDLGDPKAVTIQWDAKGNILTMQAIAPYSDSNLVVRLVGLPTPITLELVSGQRVVDYRADIHVSGVGPNSKDLPTGVTLPDSANQLLLNVLDGVAPSGSKLLTVMGGDNGLPGIVCFPAEAAATLEGPVDLVGVLNI